MSACHRAELLPAAVHGLLQQDTTAPFEVVVVDNTSRDDTAAVVRALCDAVFVGGIE